MSSREMARARILRARTRIWGVAAVGGIIDVGYKFLAARIKAGFEKASWAYLVCCVTGYSCSAVSANSDYADHD